MKNKKILISCLVLLVIVLPFCISISYSLPCADDFTMLATGNNIFFEAIKKSINYWFFWSGSWFYIFVEYLLNPLNIGNACSISIGIELIVFFLCFVAAFLAFCVVFLHSLFQVCKEDAFCISVGALFLFLNTRVYNEIFYWFVGSSYMWSVTLCVCTATLAILFWEKENKALGICLAVVGFISCTSFQAAVFPGCVYLFLGGIDILKKKKLKIRKFLPLLVMICGGLSSALAPGNYARRDEMGSDMNIIKAFGDAIIASAKIVKGLFFHPIVIIGLLIVFFIGMKLLKKNSCTIHPLYGFVMTGLCTYIEIFPLVFGYGMVYIPNRQYFIGVAFLLLGIVMSVFYLGGWLQHHKQTLISKKHFRKTSVGAAIILALLVLGIEGYAGNPYYSTISGMNEVREYSNGWKKVFREIEKSEEDDVVIYADQSLNNNEMILMCPNITSDAEDWVNVAVAEYFGKSSVRMEWSENLGKE